MFKVKSATRCGARFFSRFRNQVGKSRLKENLVRCRPVLMGMIG